MNMPRFTAEASLYKTSGHYRTGRQAINSPTKMIGPIHLAVIDVPGETVVIVEKWPPDPWEPPWIGGTGPGTPVPSPGGSEGGGGGPGGGVGGSPMTPPKKPPRPVPPAPPPRMMAVLTISVYQRQVSHANKKSTTTYTSIK